MKKWIIVMMGIGLLSVYSCSSPYLEENYQKGIQLITEGRYSDASVSLVRPMKANYKHAKVLYAYASAKTSGLDMREFYLRDIPASYDGPFSDEIRDFRLDTEKKILIAKLKAEEEAKKQKAIQPTINKAIELVKNDFALSSSVEYRMIRAKREFYPDLTWFYSAKQIGPSKFKVEQLVDNGKGESFTREWEVNISTKEVTPSNLAAMNLYR